MKISTYPCHSDPWASAHVSPESAALGGPDCETGLTISGSREERLELLTKWANAEGCELTVGEAVPVLEAAGYGSRFD